MRSAIDILAPGFSLSVFNVVCCRDLTMQIVSFNLWEKKQLHS